MRRRASLAADVLLLPDAQIDARRHAVQGPLAPLFLSLRQEIEPLLGKGFRLPEAKALLSRAGGRCERDGAPLDFDPWSPDRHRCPTCGTQHTGELHHRAWITSYQLWLAERALQGALFHLLSGDSRCARLGADILRAYAERYLDYPNQDNVLGPTRLFFSTYLESIWLLQICIAADCLARAGDVATAELVRDRIVVPSRMLIAEYDEGMSNRQVWNNAALLASAALLGDHDAFDHVVDGQSGLRRHLEAALFPDGTWYEGENYHQFALRGLWYGVTLAESRGRSLPAELERRFHLAFAAPFATALPDFTMPSRKDSQYAVSLRQWRLAELTELGYARGNAPALAGALARCYESGHQRFDTGRSRSTADVERNGPSTSLTRADLGWRALLHAAPELPNLPVAEPRSALLEGQGIAVFRRASEVYVAIDYGQSGGGHGHPDRLNLLLSLGSVRWLDDMGTASYVDPSLHWFRSTLAHNAPLVNGHSQPLTDGALLAHDEREGLGWIAAELHVDGVRFERAVLVSPDYLVDELRWFAPGEVDVDLPLHLEAIAQGMTLRAEGLHVDNLRLEDGFDFVTDTRGARLDADAVVVLEAERGARRLRAFLTASVRSALFAARGPGQPPARERPFYLRRARASEGLFRSVLAWGTGVTTVAFEPARVTVHSAGERHVHRRDAGGWHTELFAGGARSSIDLAGVRDRPTRVSPARPSARPPVVLRRGPAAGAWFADDASTSAVTIELSHPHYRRSEVDWERAGSPTADVRLTATERHLIANVRVRAGHAHFAPADAVNPYDNEHPDTMAAGLQVYVRGAEATGAWMLVPEASHEHVRVRSIAGWLGWPEPSARWRPLDDGYEIRVELPLPSHDLGELPLDLELIVNESTRDRRRRRGQLVLSGAGGEFVYLRGDRQDPDRLIPLVIVA